MDILNWVYLLKNKLVKTTIQDKQDLVILGNKVSYAKRGDKYQSYGMTVEDFIANIPTPGPVIDGDGNLIVANSGSDTVPVANGASHLIADFSGMLIVNDHYDGGVELWIAGGGDAVMINHTSAAPGTNTLTQNGNGYEWTNVDNMTGPFTFTVIKTRNGA
jgi:hypothetical protein